MKFTLDQRTLQKMAVQVGRKFPGSQPDQTLRLVVARGMVFLVGSCRRGGTLAIDTEEGECTVDRKRFIEIIKTFKTEHLLTLSAKGNALLIQSFSMPASDFFSMAKPPEKFDWFSPQPNSSRI